MQVRWGMVTPWFRDGTRFIANAYIPRLSPQHLDSLLQWADHPTRFVSNADAQSVSRDGSLGGLSVELGQVWLFGRFG